MCVARNFIRGACHPALSVERIFPRLKLAPKRHRNLQRHAARSSIPNFVRRARYWNLNYEEEFVGGGPATRSQFARQCRRYFSREYERFEIQLRMKRIEVHPCKLCNIAIMTRVDGGMNVFFPFLDNIKYCSIRVYMYMYARFFNIHHFVAKKENVMLKRI